MDNFDRNVEKYERAVDKVAGAAEKAAGVANRMWIGCITIFMNLFLAGFCLWGVYAAYTGWQLQTKGETTQGTVIEMEESSSAEGGCCVYSPVIEFELNGQTYTFDGGNASYPPDYEVGEVVDVRYDPLNPAMAQIDSYFERWAFPICIIPAMTIAALVLNFFMFRSFRRNDAVFE
jgi:hypothetical protein